jgi:hypothetical protein
MNRPASGRRESSGDARPEGVSGTAAAMSWGDAPEAGRSWPRKKPPVTQDQHATGGETLQLDEGSRTPHRLGCGRRHAPEFTAQARAVELPGAAGAAGDGDACDRPSAGPEDRRGDTGEPRLALLLVVGESRSRPTGWESSPPVASVPSRSNGTPADLRACWQRV